MAFFCKDYKITKKEAIAGGATSFVIECPEVAAVARAGQFVHIEVPGFSLRRPISICEIDRQNGSIRIVFEVRGKGTAELAKLSENDVLNMIGPLGNGFSEIELPTDKKIIVVGGGIGVPPMLGLAAAYEGRAFAAIGFRSSDRVILEQDFVRVGARVAVCTDDGSKGIKGIVTFPLIEELEKGDAAMIYACGPAPMLKAVINTAKLYSVPCEVSLEERMACGVGACVGCACRVVRGGKEYVLRVCKDGPVFKAEEVIL